MEKEIEKGKEKGKEKEKKNSPCPSKPTEPIHPPPKPRTLEWYRAIPLEERQKTVARIVSEHPDRIPVVIIPKTNVVEFEKVKFIVKNTMSVSNFMFEVRTHIKNMTPHHGLFIFVGDRVMTTPSMLMGSLYSHYKDEDGFLYLTIMEENTFGQDVEEDI